MTKKCAIHLKSGTVLNLEYDESMTEHLFELLENRKSAINFEHKTLVYVDQIAAIEWID
jgi:hypothetical protein